MVLDIGLLDQEEVGFGLFVRVALALGTHRGRAGRALEVVGAQECRRPVLYQPSMNWKTAMRASAWV